MKAFEQGNELFTNQEWFVAEITAVGDKTDAESNFPCSWQVYNFVDDLSSVNLEDDQPLYGDYAKKFNTAYPINEQEPEVGAIVLMRFRAMRNETENVYEFMQNAGEAFTLQLTAIQCSGDILTATYSDGCYK